MTFNLKKIHLHFFCILYQLILFNFIKLMCSLWSPPGVSSELKKSNLYSRYPSPWICKLCPSVFYVFISHPLLAAFPPSVSLSWWCCWLPPTFLFTIRYNDLSFRAIYFPHNNPYYFIITFISGSHQTANAGRSMPTVSNTVSSQKQLACKWH